jgi:hypothetical protein
MEHCLSAPGGDVSCQSLEATLPGNHHLYVWQMLEPFYTNVYLDPNYFFYWCNIINVFQTRQLDCSGKYRNIILSDNTHHSTLSFSWWLAVKNSMISNFPWVGVHTFLLNVLQLVLGSYPPYLNKVMEMFSFSLQTYVTSNKHTAHHMGNDYIQLSDT